MKLTRSKLLDGRRSFCGFRTSCDGFAATEFALLVPVLLALFLGGVSAFDAHRASATLVRASTTAADLATRQTIMTDSVRDATFAATTAIADRYGQQDDFRIVMTSISNPIDDDNDDQVAVDWSVSSTDEGVWTVDSLEGITLPSIAEGDSLVIVVVSVTNAPLVGSSVVRPWDIERISMRRPRFVRQVVYEDL